MCMEVWWKILRGESKVVREKPFSVWVLVELMCMEKWWIETDRGKLKNWEKKIIHIVW